MFALLLLIVLLGVVWLTGDIVIRIADFLRRSIARKRNGARSDQPRRGYGPHMPDRRAHGVLKPRRTLKDETRANRHGPGRSRPGSSA